MRILTLILAAAALASCDRSNGATPAPGVPSPAGGGAPADVLMLDFGSFEYVERAELPESVRKWNGKRVRTEGYMNPGRQIRDVKEFELVMNRESCCYGTRPKMNHFFQVLLKGAPTVFTSDPITVEGTFVVDEKWDGDWQLGLYWLQDARIVK